MASPDLQHFIATLERRNELAAIDAEVDPLLEIAAITDRVCKSPMNGPALLFRAPTGSRFPVATNLFGSPRRVCLALGVDHLKHLTERMSALLGGIPAPELSSLDRQIAGLADFSRFSPHASPKPDPRLTAMAAPDLGLFPFLQSWPGDGGSDGFPRYITLGQVYTRHPESGHQNCGMYGAQLRGPTELALRWKQGSGAGRHLERYRRRGVPMPVAITLGGPPAMTLSALFPLPGELDELTFAGFLASSPLRTTACRTVPLMVPAACELLIEGYVNPAETVREGPFGNHTGSYSPATDASLMRVTTISHRPHAIIPATVVGPPPMEDCWMARAWERLLLAFLQRLIPGIAEICLPLQWVFHQSAIISLENPTPAMVRETASRLWETPWFTASRLLIFVDAGTAPDDLGTVAWSAINSCDVDGDMIRDSSGLRTALDATGCRMARQRIQPDEAVARRIARRWKEYGLE
ncbi:UbiD family decarboxylase [Pelobacter propionicus]|uniref:3-octaprenyl-4hydroxybenzoate decarboxylase n=1 Tax=Pelobacter propionicus (strain DSM 2379 / NBRC 103807 / OttBd1) TaxID=338966 RepID=A1AKQ5_PELPD|nr:UbiD family decarboxylase [Pelobacter propionicus]ABK97925.1 3-octaprenyl-4hydroxybenzoate decarboxylase [Pelobacter propionicus DSM 2379]